VADFVEIDLSHPDVAGVEPDYLAAALVFGAGSDVVAASWVGGERVYGGNP
jgi:cytosine/adenosine deaminase-related metal-dependent hydrolase